MRDDAPHRSRIYAIDMLHQPSWDFNESHNIVLEDYHRLGSTGYVSRVLTQIILPYTNLPRTYCLRKAHKDNAEISLNALSEVEKTPPPYGSLARLMLAWIINQGIKHKEERIEIGQSPEIFRDKLEIQPDVADRTEIVDQTRRILNFLVNLSYRSGKRELFSRCRTIRSIRTRYWDSEPPNDNEERYLNVHMDPDSLSEILTPPVPADMDIMRALMHSPMAMDVYTWVIYWMKVLEDADRTYVKIPWFGLKMQFGDEYIQEHADLDDFKSRFTQALNTVSHHLPEVEGCTDDDVQCQDLILHYRKLYIPSE